MIRRRRPLCACALVVAVAALLPASAEALSCGALRQPTCVEAPPPGVELTLSAAENPAGLAPLATAPSPDRPLWPKVRGHKPYGFNAVAGGVGSTTVADEAYLSEQVGASMARVIADWAMIQYYPGTQYGGKPWNYERYLDPIYRAYVKRGIRPLLTIARTPRRFTHNASTLRNSSVPGCGTSDACWNPVRSADSDRLRVFAADLAKRYPLAAGIEFWNEPNLKYPFWGGDAVDPRYYATLTGVVYDAVKAVRPDVPVLAGAVNNTPTSANGSMSMGSFLSGALAAGMARKMDALSYHPYLGSYPAWTTDTGLISMQLNGSIRSSQQTIADAFSAAGQAVPRLVPTEFGASTTDGFTPETQNNWLSWQFLLWDVDYANLPLSDRVDGAFAHTSVEDPTAPGGAWEVGFGWTKPKNAQGAFATKPVYCDFRVTFGGFSSCPAALTPPAP